MGLQRKDCLSIVLHVTASVNRAEIPPHGLSLYTADGKTRIGDGDWYLNRLTPAGGITIIELSTEPA